MSQKLIAATLLLLTFLSAIGVSLAKEPKVKMFLFYANWNANSQKAQNVTCEIAKSYQSRVGYKALDVDSVDTFKFIKNHKINIPRYIPSIVLVDRHKKIITTKKYRNESKSKLKNSLDSYILPKI